MKKVLLLLSVMGLVGCGTYTLKNEWEKNVKVGETVVEPGECSDLSNAFFGLFGVFPVNITDESDGDLPNAKKDVSYEAGNYVVTADGAVKPSDEDDRCEVGKGKPKKPETPAKKQKTDPATLAKVIEELKKLDAIDDTDFSGDEIDELDGLRGNLEQQITPEELKEYQEQQAAEAAKAASTPAGG